LNFPPDVVRVIERAWTSKHGGDEKYTIFTSANLNLKYLDVDERIIF
jgi:hypothetical protein